MGVFQNVWKDTWGGAAGIEQLISLDLDYIDERYRTTDSGALVEKPWGEIVNNYAAPAGRTYFDSAGVLQTAGANEMIIEYDPATGAKLGNRIWGGYRNMHPYSADYLSGGWQRANCTIIPSVAISPDGALTAGKLVEHATNSNHRMNSNTYTGSGYHAGSFIVKASERTMVMVFLYDGASRRGQTLFDLSAGSVIQQQGGGAIVNLGGGWYRTIVESSELSGTIVQAYISIIAAGSTENYLGDGVSGVYIWNSMLDNKKLGPEIITAGGSVTIVAESQTIDDANFSDFWNPSTGTLFIECSGKLDAIALKAAGIEVIVDSVSNKKYCIAYTADPSASSLIIGANLNGYIRRILYFRKALPASIISRLVA